MIVADKWETAKELASKMQPGRYLMTWTLNGASHTRPVIVVIDDGVARYCFEDEMGKDFKVFDRDKLLPLYVAIASGTRFTPEDESNASFNSDVRFGDLPGLVCFVCFVGCDLLG